MPSKIFYVAVGAEVLRIATTETETFKSSCTKIISREMKQGGTIRGIKECLRKINVRNFEISKLFSTTCFDFLQLLL